MLVVNPRRGVLVSNVNQLYSGTESVHQLQLFRDGNWLALRELELDLGMEIPV